MGRCKPQRIYVSKSEHSPDGIKRRMNGDERRVTLTTETKDPHHTPKRKPDAKFKGVAGRMKTTTTVLENAKFRKGLRENTPTLTKLGCNQRRGKSQ